LKKRKIKSQLDAGDYPAAINQIATAGSSID